MYIETTLSAYMRNAFYQNFRLFHKAYGEMKEIDYVTAYDVLRRSVDYVGGSANVLDIDAKVFVLVLDEEFVD